MDGVEAVASVFIAGLRLAIELLGALVIGFGVVTTVYSGLRARFAGVADVYQPTRVRLAHYLVLGLELQLASDILGTAIAPSWEQIGQLAAIAVIRTFLNFFLEREQREMAAPENRVKSRG